MISSRLIASMACALSVGASAGALGAYPERPITMIVAFVPGGGSDTLARAMVPYLERQLGGGAKIIVLNRPGAGGEIGNAALAAAAPDGYTVGIINSAAFLPMAIETGAPTLWPRLDLIGNVVDDPYSLVVHVETPFKSLKQLVTFAKANPGAVNVGMPGSGITAKLFEHVAGVKLNIIP